MASSSYKTFRGEHLVKHFATGGLPSIKGWNRLEGRPRADDLDDPLRARVRDPLWMITRQWQLGELTAEDAGSPIFVRAQVATAPVDRVETSGGGPAPMTDHVPLEAMVEAEAAPLNLAVRAELGHYLGKLLDSSRAMGRLSTDYRAPMRSAYPIALPPQTAESHAVYAHQPAWQLFAATSGRCIDGGAVFETIAAGGDPLAPVDPATADLPELADLMARFHDRAKSAYGLDRPASAGAWRPSDLQYAFRCAAADIEGHGQSVLIADEHTGRDLDWYAFDTDDDGAPIELSHEPPAASRSRADLIATRVGFPGMPHRRWWRFEDGQVNFGRIDAHTTDLHRLLLMDFALVYANDWFSIPFEVPVGTVARVEALVVTNVFGEREWIPAADVDPAPWSLFRSRQRGSGTRESGLFIPPAVAKIQRGEPSEDVRLLRDEMANMVWGVENRIRLEDGSTEEGPVAARERLAYWERLEGSTGTEDASTASGAPIRYELVSAAPEGWIPFVPVRMPSETATSRSVQLQRGTLPRPGATGAAAAPIRPQTALLGHNPEGAYFVHEEEVPREGTALRLAWQRARWHGGRVAVWLGRRRTTGRGDGSSGLRYDRIEATPSRTAGSGG